MTPDRRSNPDVLEAAPSSSEGGGPSLSRIIGHFGQIQADLNEVSAFLDRITATETEPDEASRKARILSIAKQDGTFVRTQVEQIAQNMRTVVALHDGDDVVEYRTDLARIENDWERIVPDDLYTYLKDPTTKDLQWVRSLSAQCKKLRREIGLFTIPKRILSFTRERFGVGAPLDFHDQFKDELADAEDRVVVLRRLAELRVDLVGGMVDVERGMIYRVGSPGRRTWSYVMILIAALLGFGVIPVLSTLGLFNLPGFTGDGAYTLRVLWIGYLCTAVGVLIHIIKKAAEMSSAESTKGAEGGPQVILDRLPMWIHVREYRFLATVGVAIGVFGLLVTTRQMDPLKALMAGYAVDSFSDLFLQRFNTAVSAHTKEVFKALSV